MKTSFISLAVALALTLSSFAQDSLDCERIKTGKFSYRAQGVKVMVTRDEKYQTEVAPGFKGKWPIRWESPCTYVLYDGKMKGKKKSALKGTWVRVEVTEIGKESYWTIVTSSYDDREDDLEIDILGP